MSELHDGECCDGCMEDITDGFQDPDPDYCCCKVFPPCRDPRQNPVDEVARQRARRTPYAN